MTNHLPDLFGTWDNYVEHRVKTAKRLNIPLRQFIDVLGVTTEELSALPGFTGDIYQGNAQPIVSGAVSVHHVDGKAIKADNSLVVYIGRENRDRGLVLSPLANPFRMRSNSQAQRDEVCNKYIRRLITILKKQQGRPWEELKRLALTCRKGYNVRLLCWCAPKRCHGDDVALVVKALADKVPVSTIIEQLQRKLPAQQPSLLAG